MTVSLCREISFGFDVQSSSSHEIHGVVRGLCPVFRGYALVGEGMGLGGVVGILGRRTLFPLDAENNHTNNVVFRKIFLNGLSIKYFANTCIDKPYKAAHKLFNPVYHSNEVLRPLLYLAMAARSLVIKSRYHRIRSLGTVSVQYEIDGPEVHVKVSRKTPKKIRILVANELSGRLFTHLRVNDSVVGLKPWMRIGKGPFELLSPWMKLAMRLEASDDVVAYAGREVLADRLDWAGVSFEMPPSRDGFEYTVVFETHG